MTRTKKWWVAAILAGCGTSGEHLPKPWVKHEGRQEVDLAHHPEQAPKELAGSAALPSDAASAEAQPTTSATVEPDAPTDLPPVKDDYSDLVEQGSIQSCPPGTSLVDERNSRAVEYCALPNGTRHGPWMKWAHGHVQEVGPYVGGKREGWFVTFDRNGKRQMATRYADGQPAETKLSGDE